MDGETLRGQPPIVIAHRGASGYRPEHTLAAYELAIALGADFIEPDLVPTQDGVLVARHENELSDTTDVGDRPEFASRRTTKCIDGVEVTGWFTEDFTLADLKTLRVRERLPMRSSTFNDCFSIPTLGEILELVRRASPQRDRPIGLYPETKHPSYFAGLGLPLEPLLLEELATYGYGDRCDPIFIQSFESKNLRWLRQHTHLSLIQLIGEATEVQADSGRCYAEMMTPEGLRAIATYADGIGPNKRWLVPALSSRQLAEPSDLVRQAHDWGLLVHPYTFRSEPQFLHPAYPCPEAEYEQFFRLGVDGLFSDFPDVALAVRDRPSQNALL